MAEDLAGLWSEEVDGGLDAALAEGFEPVGRQGAFVERGQGFDIVLGGPDEEGADAGPWDSAEAHGAGLGAGGEGAGLAVCVEPVGLEGLLGEHEGHHFCVCGGIMEGEDAIDAHGDELSGGGKDGGSERTAGLLADIFSGEFDGEGHLVLGVGKREAVLFLEGGDPIGEGEGDLGGKVWLGHDFSWSIDRF